MTRLLAWMPPACAFLFPLHPRATTPLLIAWGVLALAVAWAKQPRREVHQPAGWWGGPLVYGLLALGLGWSTSPEAGLFALEVKAGLLVLPALFLATERMVDVRKDRISRAFLLGLLVAAALGLGDAAWTTLQSGSWEQWRYAELAGPLHPTYLAWYWTFGLFVALTEADSLGKWAFTLLAAAMIGLLASKAGWVAGGVVLGAAAWRGRRWRMAAAASVVLVAAGWWAGAGRAVELANGLQAEAAVAATDSPTTDAAPAPRAGSTTGRLQAWSAAWSVLLEHPMGVGTGSSQAALDRVYAARGDGYAASHHMNAHNAYLEAAVAWGWGGVFALLLWWSSLVLAAWRFKCWDALAFVLLAAWMACTESVFELQSGVVWMAFGMYAWGPRRDHASAATVAAA